MANEYFNIWLEKEKKRIDAKFEPVFEILRHIPEMNRTLDKTLNLLENRHKIVVKDTKLYNELHGK